MKLYFKFPQKNILCICLTGFLIFVAGIVLLAYTELLAEKVLNFVYVLGPSSLILTYWQKPAPLVLDFYFFNWTNPEELYNLEKKPKFVEVGPYRFDEIKVKVNVTWNENDTVTYRQLRYWKFDEEGSNGRRLLDEITNIDVVATAAAHQFRDWGYFAKKGFSLSLGHLVSNLHHTKTVRELLFEGYQDNLVDLVHTFPFLAGTMKLYDKFGYMYPRNMSYTHDGTFNVGIGKGDGDIGEMKAWKYYKASPYFKLPCSQIGGSAMDLFPPRSTKTSVDIFVPDICRQLTFEYQKDAYIDNMHCYRYSAQERMLDNGTLFSKNRCHCNGDCVPSGLLNISTCKDGAPLFASLPHFYGADPVYLTMIDGMNPSKSKHEMYVDVEPKTGVSPKGCYRLQVNIRLRPIQHITLFEEVPDIFIPIFWFEQKYQLSEEILWLVTILINLPLIFITLGMVLVVCGILVPLHLVFKVRKMNKYQSIQQNNGEFTKSVDYIIDTSDGSIIELPIITSK